MPDKTTEAPSPKLPEPPEPTAEPEEETDPPDLTEVLRQLGIVLAVILAVLVLWALVRRFRERTEDEEQVKEDTEDVLGELRERTGGQSAEQLAEVEDFDLAIHALLLDALERLIARRELLQRPSLTSREILRTAGLDLDAYTELDQLVRAAEQCIFALEPADRALYEACKASHVRLVAALERMPEQAPAQEAA